MITNMLCFVAYLGRFSFYDMSNVYQRTFVDKWVKPYSKHITIGNLCICWTKKRK